MRTTMARPAASTRGVAAGQDGEVNVARYCDASRLGRNRAIQILEHFAGVGLRRRVGEVHR